jgi:hypothetical protein
MGLPVTGAKPCRPAAEPVQPLFELLEHGVALALLGAQHLHERGVHVVRNAALLLFENTLDGFREFFVRTHPRGMELAPELLQLEVVGTKLVEHCTHANVEHKTKPPGSEVSAVRQPWCLRDDCSSERRASNWSHHKIQRTQDTSMAYSSILGADTAPLQPGGRDSGALGPSDNSDSGSDAIGTDEAFADSDAVGTGERGAVTPNVEGREGGDIAPDRIVMGSDAEDALESGEGFPARDVDAMEYTDLDANDIEADADADAEADNR